MNEPHWKTKHDWWVEDFKAEYRDRDIFLEIIKYHPDDKVGDSLRETLKLIDKRIAWLQSSYKKIYGNRFKMELIK